MLYLFLTKFLVTVYHGVPKSELLFDQIFLNDRWSEFIENSLQGNLGVLSTK